MKKTHLLLAAGLFLTASIAMAADPSCVSSSAGIGAPTPNLKECVFNQGDENGSHSPIAMLFVNLTTAMHTSVGATFSIMYILGISLGFIAFLMMRKGVLKKDGGDPEGLKWTIGGGFTFVLATLILNTTGYIQLTADTVGMGEIVNSRLNLKKMSVSQFGANTEKNANGFLDSTRSFGVSTTYGK